MVKLHIYGLGAIPIPACSHDRDTYPEHAAVALFLEHHVRSSASDNPTRDAHNTLSATDLLDHEPVKGHDVWLWRKAHPDVQFVPSRWINC